MSIDLGTGDGRLPWTWARQTPERFFVGLDANAAGLRELSGRAFRAGLPNLIYVRAAVEDPPAELAGVADRVSVVLPWGSLLAAVAGPSADVLRRIRGLCQPDAGLTIVLGGDPVRDRAELLRLGLPALDRSTLTDRLATPYAEAGFTLAAVRPLGPDGLARWPSTWARRLAQGRDRLFFELSARAR